MYEKEFPVSIDSLYEMMDFVGTYAQSLGFLKKDVHDIEVATEEAIVNIIKHSCAPKQSHIHIACNKCKITDGLQIMIQDQGIPFNPLSKASKKIDIKLPIEHRQPGGFGILLILKFMDKVEYKYENNMNILVLTKYKRA